MTTQNGLPKVGDRIRSEKFVWGRHAENGAFILIVTEPKDKHKNGVIDMPISVIRQLEYNAHDESRGNAIFVVERASYSEFIEPSQLAIIARRLHDDGTVGKEKIAFFLSDIKREDIEIIVEKT